VAREIVDIETQNSNHFFWSARHGAEEMSWPDGGTTPFRGEKNTNWEGGYRVPSMIRWPGVINPARSTMTSSPTKTCCPLPTLLAAAGAPIVTEQLLKGMKVGDKTFKVHLDGYDITDALSPEERPTRATSSSTGMTRQHSGKSRTELKLKGESKSVK
jgi:arylsulfatase A-like enzyme